MSRISFLRTLGVSAPVQVPAGRHEPAFDWMTRAACHDREMVGVDEDAPDPQFAALEVQLAKKLCADCPVTRPCLRRAERLEAALGADYAQGVWGGLTPQERATHAVLGRAPAPCAQCGLDCVPIRLSSDVCSQCDPGATYAYADYRELALPLVAAGLSYGDIAEQLRLSRAGISDALRRWGRRSTTRTPGRRRSVMDCGTQAAKIRHHRAGETDLDCACRDLPWERRESKRDTKEKEDNNETSTRKSA